MLKFFLPPSDEFFQFFQSSAEELVHAGEQFKYMLSDLNNRHNYARQISLHEDRADKIEEATLTKLHRTFITPFDRFDIHRLVSKLDDTVDSIERISRRIVIYKVTSVPNDIIKMGELCHQATQILLKAVGNLNSLSNSTEILTLCDSIKPLENEADQIALLGVVKLFKEESDIKQLLQTKELYEQTKSIIVGCRTVAIIIKDIVLEYS